MIGELELTILQAAAGDRGFISAFAVTDQMVVASGGSGSHATIMASSNARRYELRSTPRALGLRDALAVGDAIWVCGEYGQLATSRDHGETWTLIDVDTQLCLFGLALGTDGAIWCVGDNGFAVRILGERPVRVDFDTTARLSAVYAVRDEICVLGFDGKLRRWVDGKVTVLNTGTTKPLTALACTKSAWIVTGDGGFIGRSPDGTWFSRVKVDSEVDLEGIATLRDGRVVVVGDRGTVLVSSDEGRSWASVPNKLGLVHLWGVERFGGGVLIGGDDGLVVKLAPPGDLTWAERVDVFGGPRDLDVLFAAGPTGFIERGLSLYLASLDEVDEDEDDAGDDEDDDDGEDDGEEDDDEDDDDDDDEEGDEQGTQEVDDDGNPVDEEAFSVLAQPGDADDFADIYGVPMPPEAVAFWSKIEGANSWSTFEELRLDNDIRPDVGEKNLFELMVRRNQQAYLGTDLVEAFCGVFGIGSQGNGDTYHMEIYEWDGPRQIIHFDHETASFSGVFADSLDSLVYLASIVKLGEAKKISQEAYDRGIQALRGKVSPTWHFSIDDKDSAFVHLEAKRRESEFFFYRSRWICALLKNDGVVDIEDIPDLFQPELNQVVPAEQLPARYEACEKFIPTALYAMWRAYLFDEPELDRYLEIARVHAARLVRDAAKLIDELRGGRNTLGTIKDVRAWLAEFRALDLDPRGEALRAERAAAKAAQDAKRAAEVAAELERAGRSAWPELAWKWIDDGVAHRTLLAKLNAEDPAPIVALDELETLDDAQRAVVVPRIAAELSPEMEAVLVGSLLRDDALGGVVMKPEPGGSTPAIGADDDADADDDRDDDAMPGWDAIDRALAKIYPDQRPQHWGTVMPYGLGGDDPLPGLSAYERVEPVPHWHFVTYGFTDLHHKETDDPEESGFGFELTLRIARALDDHEPPTWALNFLQNLARYVFNSGNAFAAGHKMGLNGPIALDHDTKITAVCFADDPELGEIESPFGAARFVQIVGITDDEYRLIQEWTTTGLVDILRTKLPVLVTDLARSSVLDDPIVAREVEQRVAAEGSSEDLSFAGEMKLDVDDGRVRIELGALYAPALPRAMRGRLRHDRPYELRGRGQVLELQPAGAVGYTLADNQLTLLVTQELAREIEVQLREAQAGAYDFEAWPALEIEVTPSYITARDGAVVDVKGIADPARAKAMIDEENARRAAKAASQPDADDDDGDDDDDDDGADDAEPRQTRPERVAAALRVSARALRLAPSDPDIQFTHAILLVDGDDAGLPGTIDELLGRLSAFEPGTRINVAVRLGQRGHARFVDAVDTVLSTTMVSFGDISPELFGELGELILEHAPDRMRAFVPMLPDSVDLLSALAYKAIRHEQPEAAMALYDRVLAEPIPESGTDRANYLRALNNACVQAHAAKAFAAAVKIADRAQSVAHENPYIYHSAACAYAAVGDYARALQQVKLAIEHEYDHVQKVEVDTDLGALLEWPEFKALFREWHARQEGN